MTRIGRKFRYSLGDPSHHGIGKTSSGHRLGLLDPLRDLGLNGLRKHLLSFLKDADAKRSNIIKQLRSHLGQAQADDVAVFQYCGHGARWKSAKPFDLFYPDGKDEGLVCYDSRGPGAQAVLTKIWPS